MFVSVLSEEHMDKEDEEQMLDNFVTFFIAGGILHIQLFDTVYGLPFNSGI